jgi:hypothetical protein
MALPASQDPTDAMQRSVTEQGFPMFARGAEVRSRHQHTAGSGY